MKCETCQELLSEFIDEQLDEKTVARVKAHLMLCVRCAEIYEDFYSILGVCDLDLPEEISLPNEQALWCRINNIIESETKPETEAQPVKEEPRGWFSKMWHRSWSLSFTQLAAAVTGIIVISSLLTVVGIQNVVPIGQNESNIAATQPTLFEKVLSRVGLAESQEETRARRMHEQQAAIEYWNNRVASRRVMWNKNLRDAFDRNLNEIDQVVSGYNHALEQNPQDDLSNEMLDSAMTEKVALLREFSEL